MGGDQTGNLVEPAKIPRAADSENWNTLHQLNRSFPMRPLQTGDMHEASAIGVAEQRVGRRHAFKRLDREILGRFEQIDGRELALGASSAPLFERYIEFLDLLPAFKRSLVLR